MVSVAAVVDSVEADRWVVEVVPSVAEVALAEETLEVVPEEVLAVAVARLVSRVEAEVASEVEAWVDRLVEVEVVDLVADRHLEMAWEVLAAAEVVAREE